MRRAAVICEFNPFHNGHKFLIEKIKPTYADEIVCIMSGNFVQRGDIAITDKYTRAAAALENGADLIAELPTAYAVSAAPVFAAAGVRMAYELGCDILCFGAEDDLDALTAVTELLKSDDVQRKIAAGMQAGASYPRALSEAVGEGYASVVSRPNNILAIEYIRACRTYNIEPIAIRREGVVHNDKTICGEFASATMLREMIVGQKDYTPYTPMRLDHVCQLNTIEPAILYKLKTMHKNELALLPDVAEGLENRIYEASVKYNSLKEILEAVKTKRYTMARLRRIVIHALLNITKEMQATPVPYLRILGIKEDKRELIGSRTLPLIVDVKAGYDRLQHEAKEIFGADLSAAHAMNIALKTHALNEFSHGLIVR